MPSNSKSPHASSFKTAIKHGTPAGVAVNAIAKRSNKRPSAVFTSLHKAGLCHRQKFNGQYVYWACEGKKSNATIAKGLQLEIWQSFIDWCIASGHCKPEQLQKKIASQQEFMNFCRKFFNKQFSAGSSSTVRKSSTRRSTTNRKVKRITTRKNRTTSYKFPRANTTTRRYRRAA